MDRFAVPRWASLPLVLLLAACFESTGLVFDPTVDGYWVGSSQGLLITLELTQEAAVVTGTGTVIRTQPIEFTVREGSHDFPNLTLVGDPSPRFASFHLTGSVFEGHITATLNGSGFRDFDVHLQRW